jgi:hypothetical protein
MPSDGDSAVASPLEKLDVLKKARAFPHSAQDLRVQALKSSLEHFDSDLAEQAQLLPTEVSSCFQKELVQTTPAHETWKQGFQIGPVHDRIREMDPEDLVPFSDRPDFCFGPKRVLAPESPDLAVQAAESTGPFRAPPTASGKF